MADERPGGLDTNRPLNRAERRHPERLPAAPHRHVQDDLQPAPPEAPGADESVRSPVPGEGPMDSAQKRPDQGPEHDTGPGSGGATESGGRLEHHEGTHLAHVPNA
jgi:hypothetical protein